MKHLRILQFFMLWAVIVLLSTCIAHGQSSWQFTDGPYYAVDPRDAAISSDGTIYTIGGMNNNVVKSRDNGASWSLRSPNHVRAVGINPFDPTTVYAAERFNENGPFLYKSVDSGKTWELVKYFPYVVDPASIEVSPHNSNVVYIGFREVNPSNPLQVPSLWRSTDGGSSWNFVLPFNGILEWNSITNITFDPTDSNYIYVSATGEDNGVWKSEDGGDTWTRAVTGMSNTEISAIDVNPSSPSILYAGARSTGEVYKSTNRGDSWSQVSSGTRDVSDIIVFPPNPQKILAATTTGIYRSTDAGANWSLQSTGMADTRIQSLNFSNQGGANKYLFAGSWGSFYRSTDVGDTWTEITQGMQIMSTRSVASMGSVVFAINDGMCETAPGGLISKSTDRGGTWNVALSNEFSTVSLTMYRVWGRGLALDPTNNGVVIATGYRSDPNGLPQDTMISSMFPHTSCDVNAGGVTYSLWIKKSTDLGLTWNVGVLNINKQIPYNPVFDPNNHEYVYVGTRLGQDDGWSYRFWRSTDGGGTWMDYSTAATYSTSDLGEKEFVTVIPDSKSGSPCQTIYFGGYFGVRKTTNGGTTWFDAKSGLPGSGALYSLVADPIDPQVLYAGTIGSGVYKTTNGGISWFAANTYITGTSVVSLLHDPNREKTVYAAIVGESDECDIYITDSGGDRWEEVASDLPFTYSLATNHGSCVEDLYAGTWAGVYRMQVALAELEAPEQLTVARVSVGGVYHPKLTWRSNALPCAEAYKIYRRISYEEGFSYLDAVSTPDTSYIDLSIEAAHNYGTGDVYYFVSAIEAENESDPSDTVSILCIYVDPKIVFHGDEQLDVPTAFTLYPNHPNPFNPVTQIRYDLPEDLFVSLKVYDVLGKEIATLIDGPQKAGYKSVNFDASGLPSGVYFYRFSAGNFVEMKKMIFAK